MNGYEITAETKTAQNEGQLIKPLFACVCVWEGCITINAFVKGGKKSE